MAVFASRGWAAGAGLAGAAAGLSRVFSSPKPVPSCRQYSASSARLPNWSALAASSIRRPASERRWAAWSRRGPKSPRSSKLSGRARASSWRARLDNSWKSRRSIAASSCALSFRTSSRPLRWPALLSCWARSPRWRLRTRIAAKSFMAGMSSSCRARKLTWMTSFVLPAGPRRRAIVSSNCWATAFTCEVPRSRHRDSSCWARAPRRIGSRSRLGQSRARANTSSSSSSASFVLSRTSLEKISWYLASTSASRSGSPHCRTEDSICWITSSCCLDSSSSLLGSMRWASASSFGGSSTNWRARLFSSTCSRVGASSL